MTSPDRQALHRPFHGRRSRAVAWGFAAGQAVFLLGSAVLVRDQLSPLDLAGFVVVAAAAGWFLSRLARVAAFPDEDGLVIRNLLVTTRLRWAQVVGVRFGGGDPWVLLDVVLPEGADSLAVMAIQRADGAWGRAEASRLATLVALHGTSRP